MAPGPTVQHQAIAAAQSWDNDCMRRQGIVRSILCRARDAIGGAAPCRAQRGITADSLVIASPRARHRTTPLANRPRPAQVSQPVARASLGAVALCVDASQERPCGLRADHHDRPRRPCARDRHQLSYTRSDFNAIVSAYPNVLVRADVDFDSVRRLSLCQANRDG